MTTVMGLSPLELALSEIESFDQKSLEIQKAIFESKKGSKCKWNDLDLEKETVT